MDFLSAKEAGLEGFCDPDVLKIAAAGNRVLVSHDRKTMIGHFLRFIATEDHPGLIVIRQRVKVGVVMEALLRLWAESDVREFRNRVRYPIVTRL
jgi:hypothetical protein